MRTLGGPIRHSGKHNVSLSSIKEPDGQLIIPFSEQLALGP